MKPSKILLTLGAAACAFVCWLSFSGGEVSDLKLTGAPEAAAVPAHDRPASAKATEFVPEPRLTEFELFSGGVFLFDADVARQCGLTDADLVHMRKLAFEFRKRLNEQIASRGTFTRLSDHEMGVAFEADEFQAERMQREFSDFAISKIGKEKWDALLEKGVVSEITARLDHFGRFNTGYVVAVTPHPQGGENEVSLETITTRDRRIMLRNRYPERMFRAIYGPIADKSIN